MSQVSPIVWAARNANAELIKELLPLIQNPNQPCPFYEETAISAAKKFGYHHIVKMIEDANENLKNPDQKTRKIK